MGCILALIGAGLVVMHAIDECSNTTYGPDRGVAIGLKGITMRAPQLGMTMLAIGAALSALGAWLANWDTSRFLARLTVEASSCIYA